MGDTGPMTAARLLASLAASFVGWAVGVIYYLAAVLASGPWRFPTELDTMAFYSGIFTAAGWCIFFAPIVVLVPAGSRIYRPMIFPFVGAVIGFVAFAVLVGWWAPLWRQCLYAVYPAVVGGAAAVAFLWLGGRRGR